MTADSITKLNIRFTPGKQLRGAIAGANFVPADRWSASNTPLPATARGSYYKRLEVQGASARGETRERS